MLRKISTPGFAALDTPSVFCYGVAMAIKPNSGLIAIIPTQGFVSTLLRLKNNSHLLLYEEKRSWKISSAR